MDNVDVSQQTAYRLHSGKNGNTSMKTQHVNAVSHNTAHMLQYTPPLHDPAPWMTFQSSTTQESLALKDGRQRFDDTMLCVILHTMSSGKSLQLLCIFPFGMLCLSAISMMFVKILLVVCILVGMVGLSELWSSQLSCSWWNVRRFCCSL